MRDARARLAPLTAAFHMSPEELKAKADAQMRDSEGKFVEQAPTKAELPEGMEPVGAEEATPPPPEEATPPPHEFMPAYSLLPEDVVTYEDQAVTITEVVSDDETVTVTGQTADGEQVTFDLPKWDDVPLGGPAEPLPEGMARLEDLRLGDRFRDDEGTVWEVITDEGEGYSRRQEGRVIRYSDGSGGGDGYTQSLQILGDAPVELLGNPYSSVETVNASELKVGDAIMAAEGPIRIGLIHPDKVLEDGTLVSVVVEGIHLEQGNPDSPVQQMVVTAILSVAHDPDAWTEQVMTAQRVTMSAPESTYEADMEAARVQLAETLAKYPDGVDKAIEAATSIAQPDPEPSERVQAMGREIAELEADPATVAWQEAFDQAVLDEEAATEAAGRIKPWRIRNDEERAEMERDHAAMWAAMDAVAGLSPKAWQVGHESEDRNPLLTDDILRLHKLKAEHEKAMAEREEYLKYNRPAPKRTFLNPEAQAILADVESVGQAFREAIDKEVEHRIATGEGVAYATYEEEPAQEPGYGTPEREARNKARQRASREAAKLRERTRATLVRESVADVQPMATETVQTWKSTDDGPPQYEGLGKHLRDLNAEEKAEMTRSLLMFPQSWVEAFDGERSSISTSMRTRGYNSSYRGHIAISDGSGDGPSDFGDMQDTMIHEFGHTMESAVPGMLDLESAFYSSRTEREPHIEAGVKQDDGGYYPVGEGGEEAKGFTSRRYTMKRYGTKGYAPRAYEIFTTGVQEVLGSGDTSYTRDGDDTQLWDFSMGALLVLGNDGHTIRVPKEDENG